MYRYVSVYLSICLSLLTSTSIVRDRLELQISTVHHRHPHLKPDSFPPGGQFISLSWNINFNDAASIGTPYLFLSRSLSLSLSLSLYLSHFSFGLSRLIFSLSLSLSFTLLFSLSHSLSLSRLLYFFLSRLISFFLSLTLFLSLSLIFSLCDG
ncbi:unnamed protein product [Acanthosepion pharaonis]|uniref:Uncharacterized protein n=1 Tax=Acanthosepion pharaonis TaxID=158019 RepID=A0A812ER31_ACAPH|nr:unnamed protein product [Sepia pharaonis]